MRRPALWLSGALLLAAPIGAGATGAPYVAVLAFAGLFALWRAIAWARPVGDRTVYDLPSLMMYLALASMLLGLGVLLGAIVGINASVSLTVWLLVGLAAAALGRLSRSPADEAKVDDVAESALRALSTLGDDAEEIPDHPADPPLKHPSQSEATALARAYGEIETMPADAPDEAALGRLLLPLDSEVRPSILLDAFCKRAERTGTRRDRHAALVLASDGGLAWHEIGAGRMAQVFELIVASADTATLAHYLRLASDLLDGFPTTHRDLPQVTRLLDIAGQIEGGHPQLSEALVKLANRIEDTDRDLSTDE